MKTEIERFEETISILVKAYLNDTVQHGNCYACAVGNIIAAKSGFKFVKEVVNGFSPSWEGQKYPAYHGDRDNVEGWGAAFSTSSYTKEQTVRKNLLSNKKIKDQIEISGYCWQDLAKIENAFESVSEHVYDRMFSGLMAVVDVLAEIHGIDLEQKESAKLMFVK